jgi:hypothetical protein
MAGNHEIVCIRQQMLFFKTGILENRKKTLLSDHFILQGIAIISN